MSVRIICFALAALFVPVSAAAQMAKEGTDNYTTTYIVLSSHTIKTGDNNYTVLELGGIARNDKGSGMFDKMGVRCVASRQVVAGQVTTRGQCVEMDKDGDQVFTTFEAKGAAGSHTLTGGTGKYAGISGKADYTLEPIKAPENLSMIVVPHKATWKLK